MKKELIYVGVAWPYVNNLFHLGHLAGALLPPDIFKRYHQLRGNEVLMVSGSDFHGSPIALEAEKQGISPFELAKKYHNLNKKFFKEFSVEFTIYTSTHTKNHFEFVQKFFLRLLKKGYIKILKTKQFFSEKSQRFLQDRYVEGECPFCHFKQARGDQCEVCGRILDPTELINPVSKIDKSPLVLKETENYFFDLSVFEPKLKRWVESQTEWRQWVKNETLGILKEGLKPRAITRDLKWGVPLPKKAIKKELRIERIEEKVFYVWFEACLGYLSGAIEYSKKIKKPNYWKKFFYQKKAKTFYFVGQDNLLFHTTFFPAQLLAFDEKINLPTNVFVQKFLLLEGEKMSKSRGWFVETEYLVKNYSPEAIRFYLALNLPQEKELNFSFRDFIETNNNILVAKVGNLIHRVLKFCEKNYKRKIFISQKEIDPQTKEKIVSTFEKSSQHLERGEIKEGLGEILQLVEWGNSFVDKERIWETKKESSLKSLLYLVFCLSVLLYPFLPKSAQRLRKFLGQKKIQPKLGKNLWQIPKEAKISLSKEIFPLFEKIPSERIELETKKFLKK